MTNSSPELPGLDDEADDALDQQMAAYAGEGPPDAHLDLEPVTPRLAGLTPYQRARLEESAERAGLTPTQRATLGNIARLIDFVVLWSRRVALVVFLLLVILIAVLFWLSARGGG